MFRKPLMVSDPIWTSLECLLISQRTHFYQKHRFILKIQCPRAVCLGGYLILHFSLTLTQKSVEKTVKTIKIFGFFDWFIIYGTCTNEKTFFEFLEKLFSPENHVMFVTDPYFLSKNLHKKSIFWTMDFLNLVALNDFIF